jgi:hypothetical protein
MATFNVSIPAGQIVDVAWPGTPAPNTGVVYISSAATPTGVTQFLNITSHGLQIRGNNVGSTEITIVTQNMAAVQFTDTINVTVTNPTPDATGSGMTVSTPHA